MFDINDFTISPRKHARYLRRIEQLEHQGKYTDSIKAAVDAAIENITENGARSFVIYGEPQSGKTEMMIALTARVLDEGHKVVIVLLNDNVQLLNQNLERFKRSGLDPAPKNFNEILDPMISIGDSEWVIFCKKNSKDLQKLIDKVAKTKQRVVIDDEADYATPNSKVNSGDKTTINLLVEKLLGKDGIYIGVTATPARLDLNNTFHNHNELWVDFPPHPHYKGHATFFPIALANSALPFRLTLLPDSGDDPKHLRSALLGFLVNVAYLNLRVNDQETNYSILVHTSGKKADHTDDYKQVVNLFNVLSNEKHKDFKTYLERIFEIASARYPDDAKAVVQFILDNRNRYSIVVMNSDVDKKAVDYASATSPATIFTIAIGGNIISRGVTFDNLLSMFFTRDVKHRIQQDTYIQRARMFGSRGTYLQFFELSIPGSLYLDWQKCFVFHALSLESIRRGGTSPVWIEDARVAAVSGQSIDRTTVAMDKGEMSFALFDYDPTLEEIIASNKASIDKLRQLATRIGDNKLPQFLIDYVVSFSPNGADSLAVHPSSSMAGYKDADQVNIERRKGFMGKSAMDKYPNALHHIKIFYNDRERARVFYKYVGNIKFLKNLKGKAA